MRVPPTIDALAEHQLGLITRPQALEVWSASTVDRRRQQGWLLDMAPGVYRLAGAPRSWRQRALAACLAIGPVVAVSGLAAGHLLRVDGIRRPPLQVTVPPGRHPTAPVAKIRRQHLLPSDVGSEGGVPVTSPARTLLDLSVLLSPADLQGAADDLVRRGRLTGFELACRLAEQLPRCDLRSVEQVADRLGARGVGESAREDWVVDALVGAGLPAPRRNIRMEIGGRVREIDLAYPEWRVAIEYDGWHVHRDRAHFEDDRDKVVLLELMGWIVLPVTAAWTPERLVERTRSAIALQVAHPKAVLVGGG